MSSPSGGFRDFRGARTGLGNTHSIFAFVQLLHGFLLSHFTLRLRQVTHDRGCCAPLMLLVRDTLFPFKVGFCTRSWLLEPCRTA
jgi:hypothetical protein